MMTKEARRSEVTFRYLAVMRQNSKNWSGFFPDLPGTAATGPDKETLLVRLSEVLALHILGMQEDGEEIPTPSSYSDDHLKDEYEGFESAWIDAAPINPVSLEIGRVINESGKSLRELGKETGIGYSVLSRLQDPFYWGHSMKSLIAFADAFNLKAKVEFVAA